jgi:hypothetical protein
MYSCYVLRSHFFCSLDNVSVSLVCPIAYHSILYEYIIASLSHSQFFHLTTLVSCSLVWFRDSPYFVRLGTMYDLKRATSAIATRGACCHADCLTARYARCTRGSCARGRRWLNASVSAFDVRVSTDSMICIAELFKIDVNRRSVGGCSSEPGPACMKQQKGDPGRPQVCRSLVAPTSLGP